MAYLTDADIELELHQMFGLPDDPDISEDDCEDDDGTEHMNLQSVVESNYICRDRKSPVPGPSRQSTPVSPSGKEENIDPNIGIHWTEPDEPNNEEIIRPARRSSANRPTVLVSSPEPSSESSSDSDSDDWKKVIWSDRPTADKFDEVTLKPKVFFPSRTSPAAYFSRFFSNEVINHIVDQTNLYAFQKKSLYWEPVTKSDIEAFLGIIILMGIHVLPSIDLYWSSDPFFRVNEIAQIMTCKRFKKILENLHLNDNSKTPSKTSPGYDKLYKVRPLLDMLNNSCKNEARQTTSQSIDEAMIRFKGVSSLKQYMPAKPIKRGYKVWVRADSRTGYVFQYEIYTGKNNNNTPELGLGANVVKNLTKSLIDEKIPAHVTFDNFFASFPLMQYLYENGIHSTGTVNINRADLPKFVKSQKQKRKKLKLERGSYKWRIKQDVAFICWRDTKNVSVLSSAFHPKEKTNCKRSMKDGKKKDFPCPVAIAEYTKRMGGVDRFDQKRGTYEVGRRSRRWWCRIFYFLIDMAITNAYILYVVSLRNPVPLSMLQFRLSMARSLISHYSSRKRSLSSEPNYIAKNKQASTSNNYQKVIGVDDEIRYKDVGIHMINKSDTPRRCRLCSTKTNNVRTKLSCTTCKVFLCSYPCFTQFHQKP